MIIPSIDLRGGKAVQLRQGRDLMITSQENPIELARRFNRFGPVAVVDLDAAMGKKHNRYLIEHICRVADVRVGGGIRDVETGLDFLRAGAQSIIIGTNADPELLKQFPKNRVIVALDHRNGIVVDRGWTQATTETPEERAQRLTPYCNGFLCTFVQQEGCMTGLPTEEALRLQKALPHPVTFAGGVATTEEAVALCKMGLDVQVGMALYSGKLDLAQTIVGSVNFEKGMGIVPTIVQEESTGQVLMLAYSSPDSLKKSLKEGKGIYFSRSRGELWEKGATSGHVQELVSCRIDCDRDTLLFTVRQQGPACHTGSHSCFNSQSRFSVDRLVHTLQERLHQESEGSYAKKLLNNPEFLLRKIMEEAFELTRAKTRQDIRWEATDLVFHLLVKLVQEDLCWTDILSELASRETLRRKE
ncbi:bifunctional phosphoribosyl-AMP cyclohydrolase/phosphoribosyl-ATP diphosphatase HisIE [Candidatus Uhrbacteria bacterium]|nr:bifunctional phosphoribosyl-AMP cyclohydrolase/phosphoribosyl-ATP diphosphatase HisIE [Candidatus Uhrbacteria bacterium]